jgi:pimeloyl-ACP methyl ester carboxylesterase
MSDFVFLHGGGQGGWVWDETIAALQAQSGGAARCLALDAPGCGTKRGRDTADIAFADITSELVEDIEAAAMQDVVLVGHSQAGMHMPAMFALKPDLFSRLIFVSCIAPDPGLTTIEMTGTRIHGGQHPFSDQSLPVRERYRLMFCNDMVSDQAELFLDKLGPDGWPRSCYAETDWRYDHLANVPVSYVLCLSDSILPFEWQDRFAVRMHARSTPRIDAGHQAMNTRPHALAEILRAEVLLAEAAA